MGGVEQIKRIIPHRYPILLVDRVVSVSPGRGLTAIKAVTCNEPCYEHVDDDAGERAYHYPPSLVLESWAQAAALLALWEQPNPDVLSGKVVLGGAMKNVRFPRPVLPGDVIEHRVRLVRQVGDSSIMEGESLVGTDVVHEIGAMVETMRPIDVLRPEPVGSPS
ncbi:beta-hydroxyacyl-ACP dehydratase [Nonomuraea sp. FMUSA5-5]|uniref:Beta-hydroxyacyl-ACP dehydratase n=1 Tax=Nonomuraea composti TaxID=2720023 RepID=A0ABX1BF21_9ACTN|nr:beta-hydroxyacyl-ACP dehydratase [Nonomuraea sp. FMUSA5-5]